MLALTVKDLENDKIEKYFGSERECLYFLQLKYPMVEGASSLKLAVAALNASDMFIARYVPYVEDPESNLLPADYLTADEPEERDRD